MSTILLVGSGGREHALAWKILQSPKCTKLIAVPGNDGFEAFANGKAIERWPLPQPAEFPELVRKAKAAGVSLAVIGPDNPLADGIGDVFRDGAIPCFGPNRKAAELESSKSFAKEVMKAAGVPTAEFRAFTDVADAKKFVETSPWPPNGDGWVVKADGLALGKGVIVCSKKEEALAAVDALYPISKKLVIEKKLAGIEVSWMAFCDGGRSALLEPVRDFKRIGEGEQGLNTGGMGAYSPVAEVMPLAQRVRTQVFDPILVEMKKRNRNFIGVLYAGLMVDVKKGKFWVIEFNARFGDPEAQVLMPRIQGDLVEWMEASATWRLDRMPGKVPFDPQPAVCVIAAAKGYPNQPVAGAPIQGLSEALKRVGPMGPAVFVAGAQKVSEQEWKVTGGRVVGSLGRGATLAEARQQAYVNIASIKFEGMQVRKDIANA